jgi:purine-nucleoside phosphorylase
VKVKLLMINRIKETVEYIKTKFEDNIEFGLVLGSGLGEIADEIKNQVAIPYKDIPNFPISTVEGHEGSLVMGKIENKNVIALKGRFHLYEGKTINDLVFPIRVFQLLGIKKLILTNAAGGINRDFSPGDLMIIKDHISFFSPSPLEGLDSLEFGVRFPDMSEVYNKELIILAKEISEKININLREGIYVFSKGPQYETPAEIKALRSLGGDAVGMSTVPEAIAAVHAGMKVLGISCITNMAAGIINRKLDHKEVMDTANKTKDNFKRLVKEIIKVQKKNLNS